MATDFSEFADKTALITGASSGLGADFARQLAEAGCNLILVARRKDRLDALKNEIADAHPAVAVDVVAMDLLTPKACQQLIGEIASWGRHVDILINNAGFGLYGWFKELPWEKQRAMLDLDIMVPTELAHLVVSGMAERGFGRILFVSSIAGFAATPTYAAYAGAKAHVLLLGEALNFELRGTGVFSTVLTPGATRTEFLEVSGQTITWFQSLAIMESPVVARIGLRGLTKMKATVVPGFVNKALVFSTRFVPRAWVKWFSYFVMRNADIV